MASSDGFKDEGKEPVKVKDTEGGHSFNLLRRNWNLKLPKIADRHRVIAEQDALGYSLWSVRLGVLADAVNLTILEPNFPFMAQPGAHEDSFPDTDPFGFSAATYFMPMTAMLAGAFTSAFIGSLSDRIGRKPCLLVCVGVSVLTTLLKYFLSDEFLPFCGANFINGLFGGTVPVALAYASDIHKNQQKKDEEIGTLIGFNMIGRSGGGIIAILLEQQGLFIPLLASAALNAVSTVFLYFYMIEPDGTLTFDEEVGEDDLPAPDTIDWKLFWNINIGALFDNIGSAGLYPLTLSPLCFETFYSDFALANPPESAILSSSTYRWIYVMVAITVIPGAVLSQSVYKVIGPAGGCVVGNALTGVGIIACLYICQIDPPSRGTLVAYVITLYGIFPLTVLSQLSTGPMLDRISPEDKRGFSQGINITIMNFATAVTPYALGTLSDNEGITLTLWLTFAFSALAVVTNTPLMFAPALKEPEHKDYQQANGLEDQDLVDRAMKGEWVPAKFLMDLNDARRAEGLPFLVVPCTTYEEDKENMQELRRHAKEDFQFLKFRLYGYLQELDQDGENFVAGVKHALAKPEVVDKQAEDLGKWFGDYLKDSGYLFDGGHPSIMKQLIMKSFPVATNEKELTVPVMEKLTVTFLKIMNEALDQGTKSMANKAFRNSVVA